MSWTSGKRTGKASTDALRWPLLCMAVLLVVSALLYGGGHAHAFPSEQTHHALQESRSPADPSLGHDDACDEQGSAGSDICLSGVGCAICAPMPAIGFAGAQKREAIGITHLPSRMPAEAQGQLRPPRFFLNT
ncbi:MAG: hypothetical protein ABS58_01515 [Mesorhizobium sp. SCN 65-20]|nr:MAG: hypothetical protein ABS58_01515 [Mesorhizobium sp. SCN 65-20]